MEKKLQTMYDNGIEQYTSNIGSGKELCITFIMYRTINKKNIDNGTEQYTKLT